MGLCPTTSRSHKSVGFANRRNFSSTATASNHLSPSAEQKETSTFYTPLNPWFVTGLSDGEGSFLVQLVKNNRVKVGWRILLHFQISLHSRDTILLERLQSYFNGAGYIYNEREFTVYRVSSKKDLAVVMDHFGKYPLLTKKFADYILFQKILDLFNRKAHLTKEGLQQVVNLRAPLNRGLSLELSKAFPETIMLQRPFVKDPQIKDPYWLSGFASGEGCFSLTVFKTTLYKAGGRVNIKFSLSQHSRDKELLQSLTHYLSCGYYKLHPNRDTGEFIVSDFPSIVDIIIPFFNKYPILGVKALDFGDFCQVAGIMKVKGHLTKAGLEEIIFLKGKMNTKR
jgi:hypothetical protein